jgi:phosphomannomutase
MKNSCDIINLSSIRFGTSGARGLVSDMTDEVCFAYTLAFLQGIIPPLNSRIALAMDLRPSSPQITGVCAAAIRYAGFKVDFCGILPTPALAFYAQEQNIAAVMITGSHIPFDRNGIKFYRASGEITKQDEVDIIQASAIMPELIEDSSLPEINRLAYQRYVDRYVQFFPQQPLAGLRLGFYEHSSVARELLTEVLQALGAEVISIGRTDQFVPIDTEAVSEQDAQKAKKWALDYGFDAVLSTDGDADRPLLGDERGHWLRGDILGILCARYLGAKAVVTPVSSNTALELSQGFTVRRTRIGSPYVIAGMETLIKQGHDSVVGFEANGGFLVGTELEKQGRRLKPLPTRDAILPMLALLVMAKERHLKLSELSRDLPLRYTASDRLSDFASEKSQLLLNTLATMPSAVQDLLGDLCGDASKQDQTDGLRLFFDSGEIVHFRGSGNAPELRCYAEADTQQRADELVRVCLSRLNIDSY